MCLQRKHFVLLIMTVTIIFILLTGMANFNSLAAAPTPLFKSTAVAGKAADAGRVVLLIIDRITWEDLQGSEIPEIKELSAKGAVGLMTTNTGSGFPRIPDNTYATIGAGHRAGGGPFGGAGYSAEEEFENGTAAEAFFRRTGIGAAANQVIHLGIAEVLAANEALGNDFSLGSIGTMLRENGIKTAVLGNADLMVLRSREERYRRQAVLIAMDRQGRVDYGDVSGRTTVFAPETFPGIRTDFGRLLKEFDKLESRAGFIVIETGDTSRIDQLELRAMDGVLENSKKQALADIDHFVGELVDRLDLQNDLVMIVAPGPPSEAMQEGNFLTPFVMAGRGVDPGVIWSGTTKRRGLIASTDIAATVADHFGLNRYTKSSGGKKDIALTGQTVEDRSSADALAEIDKLGQDTIFLYNARYPLVKGYVNIELAAVTIAVAGAIMRRRFVQYLKPLLLALTVVPVVLLVAGRLPHHSLNLVVLECAALTIFLTAAAFITARKKDLNPFIITTGLTTAAILTDLAVGGELARTSPFSYDVMIGARFYGLGNEYMGVLLGSIIVFAGLLLDAVKTKTFWVRTGITVLFMVALYFIAAPNLGTNVGGMIAAVAGLGAVSVLMYGKKITRGVFFGILLAILAVVAGFIAYDLIRPVGLQSHIGRTASLIIDGGFGQVSEIAARKWAVNIKLIKNSSWSWFYFICLAAFRLIASKLPDEAERIRGKYPWFNKSLTGIFICSVFALVFNDSGVVAASTMIIFAAAPYLTGIIKEVKSAGIKSEIG